VGGWLFVVIFILKNELCTATIERFEDLEIWKLSRALSKKIYSLTFVQPICDDFRLNDQLRGTCGSIMDNITEGFERGSRLEFVNSLSIAKGEIVELKSQLYRSLDNDYIPLIIFEELYSLTDQLTKMIISFIACLNRSTFKGQKFKNRLNA